MADTVDPIQGTGDSKGGRKATRIGAIYESLRIAIEQKKKASSSGEDIRRYAYEPNHDFDYEGWNWNDSTAYAYVNKTAEAVEVMGSRLGGSRSKRRAEQRENTQPIAGARSQIIDHYLNYTASEFNLQVTYDRCVQDAIVWGRGVAWTGMHPRKRLVTSIYDSFENLLIDPDAKKVEDICWVGRVRYKKRKELMEIYPGARETIALMEAESRKGVEGEAKDNDDPDAGVLHDQIKYFDIYTKYGLADLRAFRDDRKEKRDPRKFVVTEQGDILWEGEWEVPYHLDDEWPCTFVDLHDDPRSVWPMSPLKPGLYWQRLMNHTATLFAAKQRFCQRLGLAYPQGMSDDDIKTVEHEGSPIYAITPDMNRYDSQLKVGDVIVPLNLDAKTEEFITAFEFMNRQYELATGLHQFLQTGKAEGQFRSARAAEMAEAGSTSRLQQYERRIQTFRSSLARKEALAARYLHDPQDLVPIVGQEAAQAWGFLMKTEQLDTQYQTSRALSAGLPPQQALMEGQRRAQEMMEYYRSGMLVTLEDWLKEIDYTIEDGDAPKRTPEQRAQALQEFLNPFGTKLLEIGMQMQSPEVLSVATEFYAEYAKHVLDFNPKQVELIRSLPQHIQPPQPLPMPGEQQPAQ